MLTEGFKPDRIVLSLQIEKSADKKIPVKTIGKKEMIIDYLTENPSAKNAEISELIGTKDRRTRIILKEMIDEGILEISGSNRNRVYMLKR